MRVLGVLLLLLGIVALTFQGVTFFTHERVVDAGPFQMDIAKPHTIVFNPIVGIVAAIAGVILIVSGRPSRV